VTAEAEVVFVGIIAIDKPVGVIALAADMLAGIVMTLGAVVGIVLPMPPVDSAGGAD